MLDTVSSHTFCHWQRAKVRAQPQSCGLQLFVLLQTKQPPRTKTRALNPTLKLSWRPQRPLIPSVSPKPCVLLGSAYLHFALFLTPAAILFSLAPECKLLYHINFSTCMFLESSNYIMYDKVLRGFRKVLSTRLCLNQFLFPDKIHENLILNTMCN